MEGLQRSAVSFRRQGSSGFVWDDRFLQEEINKANQRNNNNNNNQEQEKDKEEINIDSVAPPPINTVQRSRSNGGGGRGYRTGKVSPAIEPPSPRLSVCGFCGAFGKTGDKKKTKPPKYRSR